MTDNEPQLPEDIRKALKKSPMLTPPESFYQGVLEKIERKSGRAEEKDPPLMRSPARWFWGSPMKGLATICVLIMIVLVTRETRRTQPELFQSKQDLSNTIAIDKAEPPSAGAAPAEKKRIAGARQEAHAGLQTMAKDGAVSLGDDLAATKEVQSRLDRNISGLVENPSPFNEEDAELREQLKNKKSPSSPVSSAMSAGKSEAREPLASGEAAPYAQQARDTVNGAASQYSFTAQKISAEPLRKARSASIAVQEWKGQFSGITTFRTVVIRSSQEWQTLWAEHTNYIVPPPLAPEIDFETMMVLGIFDGTKSFGGYAVEITDIQTFPIK